MVRKRLLVQMFLTQTSANLPFALGRGIASTSQQYMFYQYNKLAGDSEAFGKLRQSGVMLKEADKKDTKPIKIHSDISG